MNHRSIFETIVRKIRELLQSEEFLDAHRFENHFVRKRLLSMYQVVIFLIYTTKQKLDTNIDSIRFNLGDLKFPNISKQALSKARMGIMPSLFQSLFDLTVDVFYDNIGCKKYWLGKFALFAIDGSRLCLPPSKSNFKDFGHRFSKKNPKRQWSEALISTAYDVCNDYVIHGLIRHGLAPERSMAKEHFKVLERIGLLDNAIFIFDRGYYSEDMFRFFYEKGCHCLMRLKENYKISKNCKGQTNVDVIRGNSKKGTVDIPIRVIKVDLDNGTTEYLGTNIPEEEIPLEKYKELYFLRWPIEQKYNEIKNQHLIEKFNGVTSVAIQQEFYLTLMMCNLVSLVKADADDQIQKKAKPTNKYRYQANRSYIIGRLKQVFPMILISQVPMDHIVNDIFCGATRSKSQIQPGRSNQRKKGGKSRERKHFNNRKPCV